MPLKPPPSAYFSRSEIEATITKAVRGAGFDWGLAEEAGMCARRLVEAGLPAPDLISSYLARTSGTAPEIADNLWQPREKRGLLCPFLTGAALSDFSALPEGPTHTQIRLMRPAYPLLLLPFLQQASQNRPVRVSWRGSEVLLFGGFIVTYSNTLLTARAAELAITPIPRPPSKPPAPAAGIEVSAAVLRRLEALGMKTTVPASPDSRHNAGASGGDND